LFIIFNLGGVGILFLFQVAFKTTILLTIRSVKAQVSVSVKKMGEGWTWGASDIVKAESPGEDSRAMIVGALATWAIYNQVLRSVPGSTRVITHRRVFRLRAGVQK